MMEEKETGEGDGDCEPEDILSVSIVTLNMQHPMATNLSDDLIFHLNYFLSKSYRCQTFVHNHVGHH